jgi:hypothetical protein
VEGLQDPAFLLSDERPSMPILHAPCSKDGPPHAILCGLPPTLAPCIMCCCATPFAEGHPPACGIGCHTAGAAPCQRHARRQLGPLFHGRSYPCGQRHHGSVSRCAQGRCCLQSPTGWPGVSPRYDKERVKETRTHDQVGRPNNTSHSKPHYLKGHPSCLDCPLPLQMGMLGHCTQASRLGCAPATSVEESLANARLRNALEPQLTAGFTTRGRIETTTGEKEQGGLHVRPAYVQLLGLRGCIQAASACSCAPCHTPPTASMTAALMGSQQGTGTAVSSP